MHQHVRLPRTCRLLKIILTLFMRPTLFLLFIIALLSCRSQHLEGVVLLDAEADIPEQSKSLTQEDYKEVAEELGVDVAAIKAVVDIEAGVAHKGFWTEGKPLINFDLTTYRKRAAARKINLGKYQNSHAVIFSKPNAKKYGSQQAGQQARLDAAMSIDSISAIEGTFWGMFQIGGFNYKLCGTSSQQEFFEKMSRSERDQLELFAEFLKNTKMVEPLRKLDWASFARRYNGASYASRGYHTRLANAYKKYKAEESNSAKKK